MKSMWDGDAPRHVQDRIRTLTPGRKPEWGKMSAPQVECHLADSLKMALGELNVTPKRVPIRYPPLKQLTRMGACSSTGTWIIICGNSAPRDHAERKGR